MNYINHVLITYILAGFEIWTDIGRYHVCYDSSANKAYILDTWGVRTSVLSYNSLNDFSVIYKDIDNMKLIKNKPWITYMDILVLMKNGGAII